MPEFYTICYGETEFVDGHKHLTPSAEREIKSSAKTLRKELGNKVKVVIISSGATPALDCVEILNSFFKARSIQDRTFSLPYSGILKIMESLETIVKGFKEIEVFIVVTNPDNHECLQTRLQNGFGKKPKPEIDISPQDDSGDEADDDIIEVGSLSQEDREDIDEEEVW